MIYFLVNNGYQYFDVEAHLKLGIKASLIIIPHKIDDYDKTRFKGTYHFETPWKSRRWMLIWPVRQLIRKINTSLFPASGDILFCYTEYEPVNQYVMARFKAAGAQVYLIEDGGVASYIANICTQPDPLTLKEIFLQFWTRYAITSPNYHSFKIGGEVFPRINDDAIDALLYYKPVLVARTIRRILISRPTQQIETQSNTLLFLNQPLYESYETPKRYLEVLKKVICGLAPQFKNIYFKFHPRDSQAWRERIQTCVRSACPRAIIVQEDHPVEFVIKEYSPKFVASFFSSALMGLTEMGIEPLFLYRLLDLNQSRPLTTLDKILTELSYEFPDDFEAIDSEYRSGLKTHYSSLTIADILKIADAG